MASSLYVVGNWKMNGSRSLAAEFSKGMRRLQPLVREEVKVALCVPDTLLSSFDPGDFVRIGAQNISEFESGAYTGETSAKLLEEQGCRLTIVGHSERRQLFFESSAQVASKAAKAIEHGITPIVCFGETAQQRDENSTFDVLEEQLAAVQERIGAGELQKLWFAYEPVWAIGTGNTATPEQAQEVHSWLRSRLGNKGEKLPILYGGSVNAQNAAELFRQKDIDGGLIGGASLDLNEFESICRIASDLIELKGK